METLAGGARAPSQFWLAGTICAWSAAVSGYWGILAAHSMTPGTEQAPPLLSAADVSIRPVGDKYLLVMAVHPKCPCTHASAGELARLIARFQGQFRCVVLAFRPQSESDDWLDTGLVASLRQQPDTEVLADVDGRQALALGMSTSGAVVLYSPEGKPRYWGGVTSARGHAGENLGSDAIAAILSGREPAYTSRPVYGCHLQSNFVERGD